MMTYKINCLKDGKLELKNDPVNDELRTICPNCGGEGRTASFANYGQKRDLREKYNPTDPPNNLVEMIEGLGITVDASLDKMIQDHLGRLASPRGDLNDDHLVCFAHVRGRQGWCVGDLKSQRAFHNATTRTIEPLSFAPKEKTDSPAQLGKFVESELTRRSILRTGPIDIRSIQMSYSHPLLDIPVSCEIDGLIDGLYPLEIMSVEDLDNIYPNKITSKLDQIAEQIICCGSKKAFIMIVERSGSRRICILAVSSIVDWHLARLVNWRGVV